MRAEELIENWYEVQRTLYMKVAREFILEHLQQKIGLNAHNQLTVNALVLVIFVSTVYQASGTDSLLRSPELSH
jgi:hypothetical protein